MIDVVRVTRGLDAGSTEAAYRAGRFPMAAGRVITWHCPPVRAVIPLGAFRISESLRRTLRQGRFRVSLNEDFRGVMLGCAAREETWIDTRILRAYWELHRAGKAHSVEVWVEGALAGGVYGVALGGAFFAESKFHRVRDMSKVALAYLVPHLRERGFVLLDVQYLTEHLARLGAVEIPRAEYERRLRDALALPVSFA